MEELEQEIRDANEASKSMHYSGTKNLKTYRGWPGSLGEQGKDQGGQEATAVEPQALSGLPGSSWLI